jgi:hypothetical protein
MQLLQTILLSPARETSSLDIRGFLAGVALSSAIGAVLYIFLMTV